MRSYPKTRFEIINNTSVAEITAVTNNSAIPLMIQPYTSDKGSEDWEIITNLADFTSHKGGLNFTKHGQEQLTIATLLTNGAYVLCKRMVSDDATLANVTFFARVIKADEVCYLYVYAKSIEGIQTFKDACIEGGYAGYLKNEEYTAPEGVDGYDIPLFTITPKGRGISNISVRLIPEYYTSRSSIYMKYTLQVLENSELIESIACTFNPDAIINGTNQSIQNKVTTESNQIMAKVYEDGILELTRLLAKTVKLNNESVYTPELINLDYIVNGFDKKQLPLGGIVTISSSTENGGDNWIANKPDDITPIDLDHVNGIALRSGTFGKMGISPADDKEELTNLLLDTFGALENSKGCFDPVIFDVDRYKLDGIFDCNWDFKVKNAIIDFVNAREDLIYFADLGLNIHSGDDVVDTVSKLKPSKYCAVYHNSFDIINPYDKKQITVTMPLLIGKRMCSHVDTGVAKAPAGISNGFSFPEIIIDTLNYIPINLPKIGSRSASYDAKQQLVDVNVNYISIYDEIPVLDTLYVNDDTYTQLSFLNNVMAVQELIKVIRSNCPRSRYTFLDGDDLDKYIEDVNEYIKPYKSNFKEITLTYIEDSAYESNNIFYAALKIRFHNFINEEFFRITAID